MTDVPESRAAADTVEDDDTGNQTDGRSVTLALGLLVLAAVGLALRFIADSPMWLDEALSVHIAEHPIGELESALRVDGHPPLYYALLGAWMDLVGTSDAAIRSLSALFSILTVPVVWLIGARRSRPWAIAFSVLFLVSPFAIRYATEARMYALVVLEVALGWLCIARYLDRRSNGWLVGIAAVTAALVYTHYWSFFLIGATALVVLVVIRPDRGVALRFVGAVGVGLLAFAPWVPTFLHQAQHTGTPWGAASRPADVLWLSLVGFGGGPYSEAQLGAVLLSLLAVAGLFAVRAGPGLQIEPRVRPAVRAPAAVFVLTLVIAWFVSLVADSAFQNRYASLVLLPFLYLAARGVTLLTPRAQLAAVVVVALLGWVGTARDLRADRTQAAAIAAEIVESVETGAGADGNPLVVFCPDQLGPAVLRALPDDLGQTSLAYPGLTSGRFVIWEDYEDRIAAADPGLYASEVVADSTGPIFLVIGSGYRHFDSDCMRLVEEVGMTRTVRLLVEEDGAQYFEPASLFVAEPPSRS